MSQLLKKTIVLSLNANWQRIGFLSVERAIISLTGGLHTRPALAIAVTLDEEGNCVETIPMTWDEWIKLPVRPCDLSISTARGAIRCPLVIVEPNFAKMPVKTPKLTSAGIHERDGYIDQYTGEKLDPKDANVDHVIPKDVWRRKNLKGSPNTWENMVCCHKQRNFNKGNRLNAAAGLVLQRKPKAPKQVPISVLIKEPKHPHQAPFFK